MGDAGDDGTRGPRPRTDTGNGTPDREEMAGRIHQRAEAIRRRELETAIERLEARGELTDDQRAVLAEMAEDIVDGLLSTPRAALSEADEEVLRAAMRVYGVESPESTGEE